VEIPNFGRINACKRNQATIINIGIQIFIRFPLSTVFVCFKLLPYLILAKSVSSARDMSDTAPGHTQRVLALPEICLIRHPAIYTIIPLRKNRLRENRTMHQQDYLNPDPN